MSAERVRDEWLKALKARAPSRAFAVMRRTGILEVTAPALNALPELTWSASIAAADALPAHDPILRLTALLWPLADAPDTLTEWLTRYRFSNQERERIVKLLTHVRGALQAWSDGELRRHAARLGRLHLDHLCVLEHALALAHHGEGSRQVQAAEALQQRTSAAVRADTALSTRELRVTGKDLMQSLALTPGPKLGQLLDGLLQHVLDEPTLNEPERLLELARQML